MGIIALEVVSDFRLCEGLRMPAPSRWRRANQAGLRKPPKEECGHHAHPMRSHREWLTAVL